MFEASLICRVADTNTLIHKTVQLSFYIVRFEEKIKIPYSGKLSRVKTFANWKRNFR